jgi:signal peptidase II
VIWLWLTMLAVLVSDQTLKFLLRRSLGGRALSLGRFGSVRVVEGKLWLERLGAYRSVKTIWTFWLVAAVALVIVTIWTSLPWLLVGLLLGGSLSHIVERSLRGTMSDYFRLRFWPTFNLADLAIAAGAIGTLAELLIVGREMAS